MKRSILVPFVALPALFALSSPVLAANGLTFGGGLNVSSNDKSEPEGADKVSRFGFNLGVGYEKEVSPGFFLVPELNIETRGVGLEGYDEELDMDARAVLKMTYLQVPLFFMVKMPAGNAFVSLFAGPSLGLNLSSDLELEVGGDKITFDVKDQTNDFDFGLELGGGIEVPSGSGTFFLRPSYYLGFTEYSDGGDARNRNFKIKAGYRVTR